MSVEQIIALVEEILPFTERDQKCFQDWMIKQRNRALLERVIKTVKEDPYVIYKFEVI